jgi:hypothetical protein
MKHDLTHLDVLFYSLIKCTEKVLVIPKNKPLKNHYTGKLGAYYSMSPIIGYSYSVIPLYNCFNRALLGVSLKF